MFKEITATLMLLTFVMQTFSAPFIRLDYYLNTAAYAKECVNKAKKAMHCNGKCQVIKRIQEEGQKQTQDAEHKMDSKVEVLSSKSFFSSLPPVRSIIISTKYFIYADNQLSIMPRSFFHPPSA